MLLEVAAGDGQAWGRLHAALRPAVRDYLKALDSSLNLQDRQDMLQEVFLRTWRSAGHFRADASAKTFVFAIAKRVLCEEQLRRARLPIVQVADLDHLAGTYLSDASASQADPDQVEVLEEIHQAVAQLPDVQREAFDLAHLQDMPMAEAAKEANCSVEQLWDRLRRARKRLRRLLRDLPPCVLL